MPMLSLQGADLLQRKILDEHLLSPLTSSPTSSCAKIDSKT